MPAGTTPPPAPATAPVASQASTAPPRAPAVRRHRWRWRWGALAGGVAALLAVALTLTLHPDLVTRYREPDLSGHWRGSYGDHYVRVDDNVVRILYPSRDGRLIGALDGDRIRGQWAEGANVPLGWVEFRVDRRNRRLKMSGLWGAYNEWSGPNGPKQVDGRWQLERRSGTIPPGIARRLANPALFPSLPEPNPEAS
jgi:hypothetical protein